MRDSARLVGVIRSGVDELGEYQCQKEHTCIFKRSVWCGSGCVDAGRYLAANILGAKYLELPGDNHNFIYERDVAGEVEEFLTGSRHEVEVDRVLATVLFTDIIGSTKRAAELGDRQWRTLLDPHDEAVRQQLVRFRGHEVKNLGDGFMATFDGPARALRCASAIADAVQQLGIAVRGGLHTGEIELKGDDIGGIAVNIAARVAAMAGPNEDRGRHALKGLPEEVQLYTALGL